MSDTGRMAAYGCGRRRLAIEVDFLVDEVLDDRDLIVEALYRATVHGHPVYDLLSAVLARRTGAVVLTCDRRLTTLLDTMGIAHQRLESV